MEISKALEGISRMRIALATSKIDGESISMYLDEAERALNKEVPKAVLHFIKDDTFNTTCCGIEVSNEEYKYCPECGQLLGKVVKVNED